MDEFDKARQEERAAGIMARIEADGAEMLPHFKLLPHKLQCYLMVGYYTVLLQDFIGVPGAEEVVNYIGQLARGWALKAMGVS